MNLLSDFHNWRFITKVFIIINAFTWFSLMAFVPNSLTYVVAHSHGAGIFPQVLFAIAIVILLIDLGLTDHRKNGRRQWCFERFLPGFYMQIGAAYLIFAYLCSYIDNATVLMMNALIQALMAGWVAYLQKVHK